MFRSKLLNYVGFGGYRLYRGLRVRIDEVGSGERQGVGVFTVEVGRTTSLGLRTSVKTEEKKCEICGR